MNMNVCKIPSEILLTSKSYFRTHKNYTRGRMMAKDARIARFVTNATNFLNLAAIVSKNRDGVTQTSGGAMVHEILDVGDSSD